MNDTDREGLITSELGLSPKQAALYNALARRFKKPVDRGYLVDFIWGDKELENEMASLSVLVNNTNGRLWYRGRDETIMRVVGYGYKMTAPPGWKPPWQV